VRGKAAPETEKPAPVSAAELRVTAAEPVEDRVIDWEVVVFTATLPKVKVDELVLKVGTEAPSCKAKVGSAVPAVAVSATVCAVETAETAAEKPALVAPDATVTAAGTVTEEELLARFTVNPPLAAAAFRVTVQASVPAPVIDALVQEMAVKTGVPVPLRAMTADAPVEELLAIVSVPEAGPVAVGSN
jgi:hypothetical protein